MSASNSQTHTNHQLQLCGTFENLLTLLRTKFSESFKPALEPAAALVEAALADDITYYRPAVGAAALQLFVPLLKQQPNPRKSWDAVVPRLFALLINAGFSPLPAEEEKEKVKQLQTACREVLSCALFHQAHVASIADAANIALAPPKVVEKNAADFFTPKTSARLYTSQLFIQLGKLIKEATAVDSTASAAPSLSEVSSSGVFLALPWLVEQYAVALNRYKRAAEIAAAIASQAGLRLPTPGGAGAGAAGDGGEAGSKEKETRSIGGVSVDADFKFFTAITSILQKKLNSLGEALLLLHLESHEADYYRSVAVQNILLITLGSVCSTLKPSHIYRPTEDPEGKNRQWLADLVTTAVQCSTPQKDIDIADFDPESSQSHFGSTAHTTASLKVLEAVLAVEHRGVQPHLPLLWPMLWATVPPLPHPLKSLSTAAERELAEEKKKEQEERDFAIQVNVATSLIHAYGELRQLEVLLSSLVRAVRDLRKSAAAAVKLVTSTAFLKVLKTALGSVPSGQVAALVRMVTSWVSGVHPDLLIADLGAACLAALHVDVTTAPSVAEALGSLVRNLTGLLPGHIGITSEGRLTELYDLKASTVDYSANAGCLLIYCQAVKLHTLCCLLHPEIALLPGQELSLLNAENKPSEGYFDAVLTTVDADNFRRPTAGSFSSSVQSEPADALFWKLAKNNVPSYFEAAIYMAAAQRLETLQYRKLHAQHRCHPGSNDSGENDAATAATAAALEVLDNEIAFLGKLFLAKICTTNSLGSPPPVLFSKEESFCLSSSPSEHLGASVANSLMFQNHIMLDALLQSALCNENEEINLTKMFILLTTRFQKAGEEEGEENDPPLLGGSSVEDIGRSAMVHALSQPSLAAVAPRRVAAKMLEMLE